MSSLLETARSYTDEELVDLRPSCAICGATAERFTTFARPAPRSKYELRPSSGCFQSPTPVEQVFLFACANDGMIVHGAAYSVMKRDVVSGTLYALQLQMETNVRLRAKS